MMRIPLLLGGLACLTLALAQTPTRATKENLGLVGGRFQPLTYNQMTPEQKTMIDHLLSGERQNLGGPFNVLLRSPEMGDLAQQFGASMRFHAGLPKPALETIIIVTARFWGAQFEWNAHKRAALQAGVSPAIVNAIADGTRPAGMDPDLAAAYNFIVELLKTHEVSDATFAAAKTRFGEKGVVDIIGLTGWYSMVSMALNVDRYPAPAELKPLANPLP
ncbi:MAG TPA: carboxymuconolactone decarboxylase family protein [Candidatus Sulfopaludibacter sp.]|jgi:4-carboxymuconolactone decarboxylase|nr:carboxymuconolactone decarboxylase family protein [Candidatus Sulfopaludibacter sp.]